LTISGKNTDKYISNVFPLIIKHAKVSLHLRNVITLAGKGRKYKACVIPTTSEAPIKHYIKGIKQ
jgi:hypothetical protein